MRVTEFLALYYEQEADRIPPFPCFQERREQMLKRAKSYRQNPSLVTIPVAVVDIGPDSLW
jgi:hypothetical protein